MNTTDTPALDLAKRTQSLLFFENPVRLLDIGSMWDKDLDARSERHGVECQSCGSPHKNTHTINC